MTGHATKVREVVRSQEGLVAPRAKPHTIADDQEVPLQLCRIPVVRQNTLNMPGSIRTVGRKWSRHAVMDLPCHHTLLGPKLLDKPPVRAATGAALRAGEPLPLGDNMVPAQCARGFTALDQVGAIRNAGRAATSLEGRGQD